MLLLITLLRMLLLMLLRTLKLLLLECVLCLFDIGSEYNPSTKMQQTAYREQKTRTSHLNRTHAPLPSPLVESAGSG